MYNGSHEISDKFALKTMAHFRYFEVANAFQQEIYRLGVNYSFNPKTNITLGVSYASANLAYDAASINLYEYRFYEDLNLNADILSHMHDWALEALFKHPNVDQLLCFKATASSILTADRKQQAAIRMGKLIKSINADVAQLVE